MPSLFGGGAERVFVNVINSIDRSQFTPIMAVGSVSGEFQSQLRNDIELVELGALRARSVVPALIRTTRKLRPDTIISTLGMNFASSISKHLLPRGTRVVLREGSSPTAFLADVARTSPMRASAYRRLYQTIYRFADAVICQSDFMLNDISTNMKVPRARLTRIYNPVDIDGVSAKADDDVEVRFDETKINILAVGRLAYEKAYDVLIRAFAIAEAIHGTLALTFVGEGPDRSALEELARTLKVDTKVRFVGFTENPYAFMRRADIFALSSKYEGFSNVLVESLALGTPAVVTDCPSANREVITEGFNGWFAEPDNPEDLARAMTLAIESLGKVDRDNIREDCRSKYSMEVILPQYENVFLGLDPR